MNLVHAHFYDRAEHVEECAKQESCAADCGHRRLDEWLLEPLFPWEVREERRRSAALRKLLSGVAS